MITFEIAAPQPWLVAVAVLAFRVWFVPVSLDPRRCSPLNQEGHDASCSSRCQQAARSTKGVGGMFFPRTDRMLCHTRRNRRGRRCGHSRRGQALVEFAIVAIALYLLLAAILTFGFLLYGAQTIQQAADFAAREISRTPLPAARDFETALDEPEIRSGVYSEDFLAVDMSSFQGDENPNETLVDFAERIGMPPVNRMLLPLMFVDTVDDGAMELLRYPGTLVSSTTASSGYTVVIPVVR
jgi:Flp pilus assembly protein TadG